MKSAQLSLLEAEAINVFREAYSQARRPVLLYSVGKDSSVLLHLARKAFFPGGVPFPVLHVDTGWKLEGMYAFRSRVAAKFDLDLLVHINEEGRAAGVGSFTHSDHTDVMKTLALRQALDTYGFDVAIGGARRDEERSRAKERFFSFRDANHRWDPRAQRPELWDLYQHKAGGAPYDPNGSAVIQSHPQAARLACRAASSRFATTAVMCSEPRWARIRMDA
jgi:sulfate adenylyltransferase subunit 2